MKNPLRLVHELQGQSPWLDNLQRRYLTDGSLERLIERGVRGLTSNPTIFQKAIQGSSDYDNQFGRAIRMGSSVIEAYWDLVVEDINGALDCFAQTYTSSGGSDGFVSVEVDPRLAHDLAGTLAEARSLHDRISRPNVMIKIPATREGIKAVAETIAEGRSVNVTLIFSLATYEKVIDAYLEGLESRLLRGLPLKEVNSVASFFISRVDSEIDARLDQIGTQQALALRGRAAVSQARLAYQIFLTKFSGERWSRLEQAGARVQRPLWASTSTKNPAYADTLYVDELIGPDTVNTLPEPTLEAFDDHGTVARTIDSSVDEARAVWEALADVGVDTNDVAGKLEKEGVQSFIKSFEELLQALDDKSRTLGV